jgi:uncharacterized protein
MKSEIYLRFYEELNDFLPLDKQKRCFACLFEGGIRVEKLLQDFKVPPDLVEIVLVNGDSVKFSHPLKNGDTVSFYPVFESLDVGPLVRVRKKPLRQSRFLVDASLSRLASYLRLFGFDTRISNFAEREDIIRAAEKDRRILLTCDAAFLRETSITRIRLVRHAKPRLQLTEILSRYDLYRSAAPYSRCPSCNKIVRNARKWSCSECGTRIRNKYRTERMQSFIHRILSEGFTSE